MRSACIIGAGAAGLTLAHALVRRGWRVILVEGGDVQPPADLEDTYRVDAVGTPHRGVHIGRFRAWGGSTTRWGGQLWPWEDHEFGPRPNLGLDGWPIPAAAVTRYYAESFRLLGLPGGTLTPDAAAARGVSIPPLDPDAFELKYSAWLPWRFRNLGRTIGAALRRDPNVEVHLRTTARAILVDASSGRATGVRVRSSDGEERDILADTVVVAAGAIESARLLFASRAAGPMGNQSGWLGRGFMDHLSVRIARFRPSNPRQFSRMFAPVFVKRVQHTPRMLLRPGMLQRESLLGAYGHWDVALPPDSGLVYLRDRLRAGQAGEGIRISAAEVRHGVSALRDVFDLARGVLLEGRRNFPRDGEIHLRVDTEQFPDRESRILPTGLTDSLGLPRVSLDWHVSELERRTVVRTAQLLDAELRRCAIGTLEPWSDPFARADGWGELKGDSFHMMGGTRMARSEEHGVVDTDSRVFGTGNLYVAGASVFPTGGMANPTLTLIALALRLADHLAPPR